MIHFFFYFFFTDKIDRDFYISCTPIHIILKVEKEKEKKIIFKF